MRTLERVELDLSTGSSSDELALPTVLIGPNGSGKSTFIEACELLRKAATERQFIGKLFDVHGGPPALLRRGSKQLVLGVECSAEGRAALRYELTLRSTGSSLVVGREEVRALSAGNSDLLLEREGDRFRDFARKRMKLDSEIAADQLALAVLPHDEPLLSELRDLLASIEVHTAIEVRPSWTTNGSDAGPRASNVIRPVARVELGGRNLPNVYHALRQQKDWPQTLARIQLALGDQIEDVLTPADPSGGRVGLAVRITGLGEVPAFSLSDGQLSYLALVGILRLHRTVPPALVVFDEPDLHLHPALARRLMTDLEVFARKSAVLVATQSDAMLDVLSEPARSTVLCDLDERQATQLRRPDEGTLRKWLEDYRGLGELRAAGYEGLVFPALETP